MPITAGLELTAHQMLEVSDPLASIFALGDSIDTVGSVLISVGDGDPEDLMLNSVIEARPDGGGVFDQAVPVVPVVPTTDALVPGQVVHLHTAPDPEADGGVKRLELTVDGFMFLLGYQVNSNGDAVTLTPFSQRW